MIGFFIYEQQQQKWLEKFNSKSILKDTYI